MPARIHPLLLALPLLALLLPVPAPALGAGPKVVVTLKPVHGLIAGIMAGIGQPQLLLGPGADPHSHALRPSEARALVRADVVFWIGPALEGYLQKPLASLAGRAAVVALSDSPGLRHLPARKGGIWRQGRHRGRDRGHAHGRDHSGHERSRDPHIWLDPRNARAMVARAVAVLARVDPTHGADYRRNGERISAALAGLEAEIDGLLAPVRALPYLVLHDAYQYFETRFRTNPQGAIAIAADRKPGARRIAAIRRRLAEGRIRCLFQETQAPSSLIETLTAGTTVRVATLDPIGRGIAPGPDAYGQLLRQLAGTMENCLSYAIGP